MGRGAERNPIGSHHRGTQLARLILDTTILIAWERLRVDLDEVIDDEDDVSIAAVTAAELIVGVELADGKNRARRQRFVEEVLSSVPVEDYDLEAARAHALLLAHVNRSGRTRGAHDLIIAATAVSRGWAVVTADVEGFRDLPGVDVRFTKKK